MDNGDYLTTKKNKETHGYGIKSIAYTVERYGGVVDAKANDSWFELKILIPRNNGEPISKTKYIYCKKCRRASAALF